MTTRGPLGGLIDPGKRSLNGNERNPLYRNTGNDAAGRPQFADVGCATATDRIEDGRAALAIDVEGDGDLDLVVQSFGCKTVLLINPGNPAHHWLELDLKATRGHPDAIGARVVIEAGGRTHVRQVASTGGYLSGIQRRLHVGLGTTARVDRLTIHWPSGQTTVQQGLAVDRRLTLVEPAGAP